MNRSPLPGMIAIGGSAAVAAFASHYAEEMGWPAGPFGMSPRSYASTTIMTGCLIVWHLARWLVERKGRGVAEK